MNNLALDLWHDLREKKMWPVAAALALALVLVPIILLKGSSPGEPAPSSLPQFGASAPGALVPTELENAANRSSSRLDVFSKATDPFDRPAPKATASAATPAGGGGAVTTAPDASATASVGGLGSMATSAGASGGSGATAPSSSTGSGSAAGSSPSTGTTSPSPKPDSGTTTPDPKNLQVFTYRADLSFGAEEVRDYESVKRLTPLPDDARPYLVYLGVSEDGKTATFLVDTEKLPKSEGEGECKPSPEECTLLSLTKDESSDTHSFTDPDGKRYELRITDIAIEPVKSTSTTGAKAKAAHARKARAQRVRAAKAERVRGEGSTTGKDAEFAFPDFFDIFRGRR